ncbi:MAG: glutathione S-transferase family protein [Bacteriovoracia bacterium]
MSYVLVVSYPSPFVRRLRMAMEHVPYEFRAINIYEEAGAAELKRLNPTNQIPCLIHNGEAIWDSRIILQYLGRIHSWPQLSVVAENRMTAIERMIDAGVGIFLLKKSNLDLTAMYPQRLHERIVSVFEWLTPWMASPEAREWNLVTLTLVAGLEWMQFREIHPIATSPEAKDFLALHAHRPIVQATHPNQGA